MKGQLAERLKNLKSSMIYEMANPQNLKISMNVFVAAMCVISFILAVVPSGYAEGTSTNYTKDISTIGGEIYKAIAGISTVLAVVGETIAACMYFFSSNGKTVEAASSWMKRIALGWVFINGMNIIVKFFTSIFSTTYRWNPETT